MDFSSLLVLLRDGRGIQLLRDVFFSVDDTACCGGGTTCGSACSEMDCLLGGLLFALLPAWLTGRLAGLEAGVGEEDLELAPSRNMEGGRNIASMAFPQDCLRLVLTSERGLNDEGGYATEGVGPPGIVAVVVGTFELLRFLTSLLLPVASKLEGGAFCVASLESDSRLREDDLEKKAESLLRELERREDGMTWVGV